jgi:hypothetical protein
MTIETGISRHRRALVVMAIIATFGIGRMQDISDQSRTVAAVGIVTGNAVSWRKREIRMLFAQ